MCKALIMKVLRVCQAGKALPLVNKVLGITGANLVSESWVNQQLSFVHIGKFCVHLITFFDRLLASLKNVEGDIVECGVGDGTTLLLLSILVDNYNLERRIVAFDSFEGLPEPSEEDLNSTTSYAKSGLWKNGLERVLTRLKVGGIRDDEIQNRVTFVKGWFSDTLPHYKGQQIALLHIDADLYNSYKSCLENLWPKIAISGIVIFKQYDDEAWPGAKKAVDEFFIDKTKTMKLYRDPVFRKYYAVKLK